MDPGLRYRALYNLGVVNLMTARADTAKREAMTQEAIDHLREALLLAPELGAGQVEPRAGGAHASAADRWWRRRAERWAEQAAATAGVADRRRAVG